MQQIIDSLHNLFKKKRIPLEFDQELVENFR